MVFFLIRFGYKILSYNKNIITRQYLNNKIIFDLSSIKQQKRKNFIKNVELKYNFPSYLDFKKKKCVVLNLLFFNKKIGVFVFETLNLNGNGEQCVYAGG